MDTITNGELSRVSSIPTDTDLLANLDTSVTKILQLEPQPQRMMHRCIKQIFCQNRNLLLYSHGKSVYGFINLTNSSPIITTIPQGCAAITTPM